MLQTIFQKEKDANLPIVPEWLQNEDMFNPSEVAGYNGTMCLRDILMTWKWESTDGRKRIKQYHLENGVNITLVGVCERFYWENLAKMWKYKRCDLCSSKKRTKTRTLGQYIPGEVWDIIAVDILKPFPLTNSENKYLMVVWTKWRRTFWKCHCKARSKLWK